MSGKTSNSEQQKADRRNVVTEYFNLVASGRFKDGLRFFSPQCITHNPFIGGSMDSLTAAMIAASKQVDMKGSDIAFVVKHILVDGELVAVHTQLLSFKSNPEKGGLRQVHLFRFEDDKIVEYWDITQQILDSMPNAAGAF
jgi:predicted SnoaL-like aldol condensation-catalyzing enzyme